MELLKKYHQQWEEQSLAQLSEVRILAMEFLAKNALHLKTVVSLILYVCYKVFLVTLNTLYVLFVSGPILVREMDPMSLPEHLDSFGKSESEYQFRSEI